MPRNDNFYIITDLWSAKADPRNPPSPCLTNHCYQKRQNAYVCTSYFHCRSGVQKRIRRIKRPKMFWRDTLVYRYTTFQFWPRWLYMLMVCQPYKPQMSTWKMIPDQKSAKKLYFPAYCNFCHTISFDKDGLMKFISIKRATPDPWSKMFSQYNCRYMAQRKTMWFPAQLSGWMKEGRIQQ